MVVTQTYTGSIPACAGEPDQKYEDAVLEEGLSPRVRGNPLFENDPPIMVGSIPACAGEPYEEPCPTCEREVYPRVCGGTTGAHSTSSSM